MNKVAKMMLLNQKNARGKDYDHGDYDRQHHGRMDYDRDYMDRDWDYDRSDGRRRNRDYERDYGRDYDRMGREDRHAGRYGREPRGREMYMEGRAGRDDDDEWHVAGRVRMPEQDYELDEETAKEWTRHMENADGTKGPHWSMDQTKQVAAQKNVSENPLEFWVAMNMMYSDYCAMAKKHNVNTVDFYVDMAKAFLDDKDAKPDKLGRYYHAVVE